MLPANPPPPPRTFLGTAAILGALTRPRSPVAAAPREAVMVIDTHVHCFAGPADARFPYHPAGPYRPPASATPQDLLRAMDAAGVTGAIIVHPEPYQDDHPYLEYCLAQAPSRFKGTALFFADR